MIKLVIVLSLLLVVFIPEKVNTTIILSIIWLFYTIYKYIKLYKIKEKKITTDEYSIAPPNNNYSAHIRYLYKGKVDYKVFVATIIELIIKGSISFGRRDKNEYYLIDNKVKEEALTKSESYVKNIIFKQIGDSDKVSLSLIKRKCRDNSGYIYSVYKEWQTVFEYECAYNKYFVSNKNVIDDTALYFVVSFIISLYNIFFTKYIWLSIIMLCVTGYICKYVNDLKNKENESKIEYEEWLKFKNYIDKNDNSLDELDIISLENYATYAYVLDSYDNFVKILNKKSSKNKDIFKGSILLMIMDLGIFDYVDKLFKDSIYEVYFNSRILFSKNKGRR